MSDIQHEIDAFLDVVIKSLEDKQGDALVSIKLDNPAVVDYMVLATGKNHIHLKALIETVSKDAKEYFQTHDAEEFYEYPKVSGQPESGWVVVDMNAIVIHMLLDDTRHFYDLDSLYERQGVVFHY